MTTPRNALASSPPAGRRLINPVYHPQSVPAYRGNPFLEALPDIPDDETITRALQHLPPYTLEYRSLPPQVRREIAGDLDDLFVPLPMHLELAHRISMLVRGGYRHRNPAQPGYWRQMDGHLDQLEQDLLRSEGDDTAWSQFLNRKTTSLLGISGIGKSATAAAILSTYPQIIVHNAYHGRVLSHQQIVWLKVDCPYDGSVKGLLIQIFVAIDQLLGTTYYQDYTRQGAASVDHMLVQLARVASIHALGLLVLDELQNLRTPYTRGLSKKERYESRLSKRFINFFVQLVNTIGVPLLPIGSFKAVGLFADEFRQLRRMSGLGHLIWGPLDWPGSEREGQSQAWTQFVKVLLRYQYVEHRVPYRRWRLTARLATEAMKVLPCLASAMPMLPLAYPAKPLSSTNRRCKLIASSATSTPKLTTFGTWALS